MADEFDRVKDDIRRRVDIVDLVGQSVSLRRNGRNWTGLCPFHDDKNPSFIVSSEYGHYRCWSCGAKGDIFTWVMETQKLTFGEALKSLAKEAGVELPKSRSKPEPSESWDDAMSSALSFFRDQLQKSKVALGYLDGRGLSPETVAKWELGYAPDVGEALAMHLQKSGFTLSECRKLFLVDLDAGGGYFDKFRGRLMFPIRDERGRLVAFGGRIIGDGQPKYINSSDTPIFSKSKILYGMDKAKELVSKSHTATVVEGYLDVIACHEAGVPTAVATLGTALGEQHANLLKRWCDKVVLFYDSDEAGQKAADRGSAILEQAGLAVQIALMPQGDDPDTLLRREGPQAVQKATTNGVTPLEFRLDAAAKRHQPEDQAYWAEVVDVFAAEPSDMEVQRHLHRIAAEYPGIKDKSAARQSLARTIAKRRRELATKQRRKPDRAVAPTDLQSVQLVVAWSGAEKTVFASLLDPALVEKAWPTVLDHDIFGTEASGALALALAEEFGEAGPLGPAKEWLAALSDETTRDRLLELSLDELVRPTERGLAMAVDRLSRDREARKAKELSQDLTDESLKAVLEKLRSAKS